jgi:hypothetical protein
MMQLDMFGGTSVAPSTSLVGLIVEQAERPCPNCRATTVQLGSSRGPHHAALNCCCCNCHRGWASGATVTFLNGVIDVFGRPSEPIVVSRASTW